jgi:uncharacterized membrane protein YwzB
MLNDEGGPSRLMARAQAAARIAVEVFVKQNQVAPVRVLGVAIVVAMTGALAPFIR